MHLLTPQLRRMALALALAGGIAPALAHTAWLEPDADGWRVLFDGHEGKTSPFPSEKLKTVEARAQDGSLLALRRVDTADGVTVHPDGQPAVLMLFFDNGIRARGADGKVVARPMNEVPGASSAVQLSKYHKTIVQWGAAATRSWGQPFELVPLDATAPLAGQPLRLRVLVDGKPAAGIKVGPDEKAPGTLSDADGVVTVLPQAGWNRIWSGQRSQVGGDPRFTNLSVEYILGFQAGPAR